ncbi:MAG: acetate--CoA ligase family protein, partial [Deltaproteobacteria bacterium]|nr:acetate--CoA ligase family protein [Deltaproteobacteria bacterium]
MDKLFYPESVVIVGLSSNPRGISRVVLENLLRWGFGGKIFGVNPHSHDGYVKGIKVYNALTELPEVPDLAVCLIPARLIPDQVEQCGKLGIQRMAIPTGGFAEFNEDGRRLTDLMVENAQRYGVRIVGPNGLTVANSRNGLCLPFLPFCKPREGNISIISQSGGVSAIMLGLLMGEHMGLAKYVSIGNKVDLDEIDFLRYFGADGDTQIIWLYLESIDRGRELIEAAKRIDKPIILYKANTTSAGKKAALSHTAALSNDENVIDAAMEEAGIIRIHNFRDFASMTKAFQLPPMRGNRIMVMSPAGGFAVLTADLCEQAGFDFAHPGDAFYDALKQYVTAGVINLSNPLDMGDLYDTAAITRVFFSVMHNENVDGAVYVSEWPSWAEGDDVFTTMFRTDFSKEIRGAIVSSRKPFGICLFGAPGTVAEIKGNVQFPIFDSPEEMIRCLAAQRDFCLRLKREPVSEKRPDIIDVAAAKEWLHEHGGIIGGESLELLRLYGITVVETLTARDEGEAIEMARKLTYPVVMKVDSPDALHKTEAQGV